MKKRIYTIVLVLIISAGVMVGCSQPPRQDSDISETSTEQGQVIEENFIEAEDTEQETSEQEVSEVKGTVDEIKDFMFIVTDNDKVSYAFTFEEKPEGLKEVSVGDKVIVKYTGTISMVDSFMGEVLSVEKQ